MSSDKLRSSRSPGFKIRVQFSGVEPVLSSSAADVLRAMAANLQGLAQPHGRLYSLIRFGIQSIQRQGV